MSRKKVSSRLSQDEKRAKRNKQVMSFVLVLLMVLSVAGIYASSKSSNKSNYVYGDYSFYVRAEPSLNNQNVFALDGDKSSMYFYSLPQDDLRLDSKGNLSTVFYPAKFFALSTDSDIRFFSFYDQLRFDIATYAKKNSVHGLLVENESSKLPVITCANATAEIPVIELHLSNETIIVSNSSENCITINARNVDLGLVRDRLLYTALGVIKE